MSLPKQIVVQRLRDTIFKLKQLDRDKFTPGDLCSGQEEDEDEPYPTHGSTEGWYGIWFKGCGLKVIHHGEKNDKGKYEDTTIDTVIPSDTINDVLADWHGLDIRFIDFLFDTCDCMVTVTPAHANKAAKEKINAEAPSFLNVWDKVDFKNGVKNNIVEFSFEHGGSSWVTKDKAVALWEFMLDLVTRDVIYYSENHYKYAE